MPMHRAIHDIHEDSLPSAERTIGHSPSNVVSREWKMHLTVLLCTCGSDDVAIWCTIYILRLKRFSRSARYRSLQESYSKWSLAPGPASKAAGTGI